MLPGLAALLIAGCAGQPGGVAYLSPCPPAALPIYHAEAAGCAGAPFCYRTLGQVDCYAEPEPRRRTVEEIVPSPEGCRTLLLHPVPTG